MLKKDLTFWQNYRNLDKELGFISVEWALLVSMFLVIERTENVSQIGRRSSRAFMHSGAGYTLHHVWFEGCIWGRNPASTVGKSTCLVCSCLSPKKGHILKTGSSSRIPVSNSQKGVILWVFVIKENVSHISLLYTFSLRLLFLSLRTLPQMSSGKLIGDI